MSENLNRSYTDTFKPSRVVLLGTCGSNYWRPPVINALVTLGLKPQDLYDPFTADWNDEARQEEERQAMECEQLIIHAGNSGSGKLPQLTPYEMRKYTELRPQTTIAIFDETNLEAHARTALRSMKDDVMKTPGITVIENVEDIVPILAQRLDLVRSAGAAAIQREWKSVKEQLHQSSPTISEAVENGGKSFRERQSAAAIEAAVLCIESKISSKPGKLGYAFSPSLVEGFPNLSPAEKTAVVRHMKARGWKGSRHDQVNTVWIDASRRLRQP